MAFDVLFSSMMHSRGERCEYNKNEVVNKLITRPLNFGFLRIVYDNRSFPDLEVICFRRAEVAKKLGRPLRFT